MSSERTYKLKHNYRTTIQNNRFELQGVTRGQIKVNFKCIVMDRLRI